MSNTPKSKPKAKAKSAGAAPIAPPDLSRWKPDEHPFIREIFAHPFDDFPRLVFADWLEERGDARAEFIRVQCRLATLPARDPEYADLVALEKSHLERHGSAWMRPFNEVLGVQWGVEPDWPASFYGSPERTIFARGFPDAVHIKYLTGKSDLIEQLIDAWGFHSISLGQEGKRDLQALLKLPLSRIGALIVRGPTEGLDRLLASPDLGPLSRLEITQFPTATSRGLKTFLEGPQSHRLRSLRLGHVETPRDFAPILEWRHLEQLDTLSLVPDAWGEVLTMIADSRMKLSRFAFSFGNFSPPEVIDQCAKLYQSPPMSEVVSLRIRSLPAGMGPHFARFPLPPALTSLYLSGQLRDSDISALSRTDAFRQLRHLGVCGEFSANLGDASALALSKATGFDKLESLDLSNSSIGDRGAEALVQSEELSGLRRLNLERSQVTFEMRASLRKMFRGKLEI